MTMTMRDLVMMGVGGWIGAFCALLFFLTAVGKDDE